MAGAQVASWSIFEQQKYPVPLEVPGSATGPMISVSEEATVPKSFQPERATRLAGPAISARNGSTTGDPSTLPLKVRPYSHNLCFFRPQKTKHMREVILFSSKTNLGHKTFSNFSTDENPCTDVRTYSSFRRPAGQHWNIFLLKSRTGALLPLLGPRAGTPSAGSTCSSPFSPGPRSGKSSL